MQSSRTSKVRRPPSLPLLPLVALLCLGWISGTAARGLGLLFDELMAGRGAQVWVIAPGLTPRWAADHLDLDRDRYFGDFLAFEDAAVASAPDVEKRIRERTESVLDISPDSLLSALEHSFEQNGTRDLILCGVGETCTCRSPCLWISSSLREPTDLNIDDGWAGLILPEDMTEEIRYVGGISRDLRWDEVAEILAFPRARLEAFRNLPADLRNHPVARLKRVFLGDKLFANAALYAISSCDWRRVAVRLGLVDAHRDLLRIAERELSAEEPEALEVLEGFRKSGSLMADRMDRILQSLWGEIPEDGALHLVAGDADSSWILSRVRD